jgi:hypothetical protein
MPNCSVSAIDSVSMLMFASASARQMALEMCHFHLHFHLVQPFSRVRTIW